MSISHHVAVWIDRSEAKIFRVEPESFDVEKVLAPDHHLTRKAEEQGHHAGLKRFFETVAGALQEADHVLIVGPSSAKLDFIRFLRLHYMHIEERVVGVETLDHPTDRQLAAYIRHYFHDAERTPGLAP